MKLAITAAIAATAILANCATAPEQVTASYVAPDKHRGKSCEQLNYEANQVHQYLSAATNRQAQAANSDAAMTAVALVLFWPAAFMVKGDNGSPELARLKGEAQSINSAAVAKGCTGAQRLVQ